MSEHSVASARSRHDGDPGRVAIVLPGRRYAPAAPLLHYARAVLAHRGWTVQEIWWDGQPDDFAVLFDWVREQTAAALARETAGQVLLVGKSMGSFSAGLATERGLPAIWLTPVLSEPAVREAIRRSSAPSLLVGGTADSLWNGDAARQSGAEVLEIPDADHNLERADDPTGSVNILGQVTKALDEFVTRLLTTDANAHSSHGPDRRSGGR